MSTLRLGSFLGGLLVKAFDTLVDQLSPTATASSQLPSLASVAASEGLTNNETEPFGNLLFCEVQGSIKHDGPS